MPKMFHQFIFSLPERKLGKFDVDFGEDEEEVQGEDEEEEVQGSSEEVQVRAREILGTSLDIQNGAIFLFQFKLSHTLLTGNKKHNLQSRD